MTYHQAQDILNERRAGADMPAEVVNRALQLTGDLEQPYTSAEALREIVGAA